MLAPSSLMCFSAFLIWLYSGIWDRMFLAKRTAETTLIAWPWHCLQLAGHLGRHSSQINVARHDADGISCCWWSFVARFSSKVKTRPRLQWPGWTQGIIHYWRRAARCLESSALAQPQNQEKHAWCRVASTHPPSTQCQVHAVLLHQSAVTCFWAVLCSLQRLKSNM